MPTQNLTWRLLSPAELECVYRDEMRRDFPPGELKPLSVILSSSLAGDSHSWGVFEGDRLAAYLLMVRPAGCEVSQLDYFAVLPAYRAAGLGAQLLAALPAYEAGANAIIIESECPERAADAAMARRRIGFYTRCGAQDTGYIEHLLDAWFRVLVLPCGGKEPLTSTQILDALSDCYRRTFGETAWKKYVQFYKEDDGGQPQP